MPTSSSSSFPVEPPPVTSGLILWLTAEANVTKDAANLVSEWRDSLTGFLSAQAGAKPLWVADAFPGHPGIRFSGGESLFIMTSDMGQNNFTIIILGRATAPRLTGGDTHEGQRFLICQNFTEGFPAISVGSNGFGIYEFGASPALRAEAVTDASVLCPLTIRYVNRAPAGYLNGNLVTQGTPTTGILCSIPHSIGGDGGTGSFVGDIAEILIYNGSFTEQDRLVVETWLQAKYDCFSGSSSSNSSESSGSSDSSDGGGGGGSSDSSASSDSSSGESSGSSDSSGDGGGSSGSSDSSGSSSSEPSDSSSSESSDSSSSDSSSSESSESESSDSSTSSCFLAFIEEQVLTDFDDSSYSAADNLDTNCSPVHYSLADSEFGATIEEDTGYVQFGSFGEWLTISAQCNPSSDFTLLALQSWIQYRPSDSEEWQHVGSGSVTVQAGEEINLRSFVRPTTEIGTETWEIEGDRVVEYSPTPGSAQIISDENALTFHWYKAGTYKVTYRLKPSSFLSQEITAEAFFTVTKPKATITTATSDMKTFAFPDPNGVPRRSLSFGRQDETDRSIPGIKLTAAPSGGEGTFGWFQMIENSFGQATNENGPQPALSASDAYDGNSFPIQPDTEFVDTPGHIARDISNNLLLSIQANGNYTTYFIFKSSKPNSIWVPIKSISWFYSGTAAKQADGSWTIGTNDHSDSNVPILDEKELRTWDHNDPGH